MLDVLSRALNRAKRCNQLQGAGGRPSAARSCGMPRAAACRTPRSSPRQLPTSSLNGSRAVLLLVWVSPLLPPLLLPCPAAAAAAAAACSSAAASSCLTPSVVTAVPASPAECRRGQRVSAAAAASLMRLPPQLRSTASSVAPNLLGAPRRRSVWLFCFIVAALPAD